MASLVPSLSCICHEVILVYSLSNAFVKLLYEVCDETQQFR